jgi:hypothetical protein
MTTQDLEHTVKLLQIIQELMPLIAAVVLAKMALK